MAIGPPAAIVAPGDCCYDKKGDNLLRRILLLLGAAGVCAGAATSSSLAAPLLPEADAYVDAASPSRNFGTRTTLRMDASPVRTTYLKFNVQGATGSAVLRVFAETSHTTGFSVRAVANTTWSETGITSNNAPPVGAVLASSGAVGAGTFVDLNVSSAVTQDGLVSLALTTPSSTALRLTSREGVNKPVLLVPAPPSESGFVVSRLGAQTYQAISAATGATFTGSLKAVVESAAAALRSGGGTITFTAGVFDLGTDHWEFFDAADIVFQGQGIDTTLVQNNTNDATDTEPFDFTGADRVTVRDMTVAAAGSVRSTSDALDFDRGNDVVVERVKVTASRGRGIVFDGKNNDWTSLRNTIRDCQITGIPGDGIELLASSNNVVEGCVITNVGGHGIQINKASPSATQANKKSNDNRLSGNVIDNAGQDGINVNSGDRNQITGNTITNSSNVTSGRDGIRIGASDSIACNNNIVDGNRATDDQVVKTQRWGLNIASSLCTATIVGPTNNFAGNLSGAIRNLGTGTIFQ